MAGHGRAPKPREQRRNHIAPSRGEWIDLEPLETSVLPEADSDWSENARRAWAAWRADPVTTQYGPADLHAIAELARLYDDLPPGERRQWMDRLGLNPKGKRDLRWRTPAEVETIARQAAAPVKRLHVVEHEKAAE